MGRQVPFVPKLGFSCNAPATCSRWRTDWPSMRPLRAWSQGPRHTIGSPVKSPGYGTSTSAVDHAKRVRLVYSKYRHPAVQYRLCSVHYGASTQLTVRTATPNSCSLPQDSSTCSIAPLRTRPAQNLVSIGAGRAGRLAGWTLSVLAPSHLQTRPDPGLPIAVRILVPSSRRQFQPRSACCWCRHKSGQHDTGHHSSIWQGMAGQASTRQIMME